MILPVWVKPAIAAVALLGAFSAGWRVESLRWHAHEVKALKQAQAAFEGQLAKQNKIAAEYEGNRQHAVEATRLRETEIRTVYRDVPAAPAYCEPPLNALGLLDGAIGDANARARGEPGAGVPSPAEPAGPVSRP